MDVEIIFVHVQVPVEEEKKLLLHQIDFCLGEAKVGEVANFGIFSPMLVLWRRVIEEFCREDEGSEEDAVDCASKTLCYWGKTRL